MRIISLYITILQIGRALEIIYIVTKVGFAEMWDFLRIYFCKNRRRCSYTKRKGRKTTVARLRETIEALGPTYVKFGQILADRPDMVSSSFRAELRKLQTYTKPFDNKLAFSLIEKALGANIGDVFSYISPSAVAAASIGQVYLATLLSGESVVVKIQRPFIENKIKLDILLMKFMATRLSKNYPELAAMNITGMVDEFYQTLLYELDYQNEAANLHLFSELFKDDKTIIIPKVYDNFTTKELLVMEQIIGVTPNSAEALLDKGLNPKEVVKIGATTVIKMILKFGVFHADPHPGNLFVADNNVVGIIDFGMVGVLRTREIDFIADFIVGFALKDETIISRALLTLCDCKYFENSSELKFDVKKMVMIYKTSKRMDMQNFATVIQRCINIMIKYKLQIPSGIFLLVKAFATLEKFAYNLDPSADLAPIVLPYAKEIIKERYSAKRIREHVYELITSYLNLAYDLPSDIGEIIYKVKNGEIKHTIMVKDKIVFVRAMRNFSLRISYVFLIVGTFIGSTILIVWNGDSSYGQTTLYISSVLMILLLIQWVFRKRI